MVIWSQLLISSEAHDPDRHPVASRHYARIGGSHRNRDGRYDVDLLETSLKDIVGNDRRLFDADRSGISGQKVAVTATTLSNASTYIFSNYNGNTRDKGCGGYKYVRPDRIENEPLVGEAGRVTSAAPGFFKTASIASLGSFQDPTDLALWGVSQAMAVEYKPGCCGLAWDWYGRQPKFAESP